jgi:hypothetical protein
LSSLFWRKKYNKAHDFSENSIAENELDEMENAGSLRVANAEMQILHSLVQDTEREVPVRLLCHLLFYFLQDISNLYNFFTRDLSYHFIYKCTSFTTGCKHSPADIRITQEIPLQTTGPLYFAVCWTDARGPKQT